MPAPSIRPTLARLLTAALAAGALALVAAGPAAALNCQTCDPGGGGGGTPAAGSFVVTTVAPVTGSAVAFHGSATGSPTEEDWDFGDGATAVATLTPSHVYAHAGTYHVTFDVSNADGGTSVTHDVVVADRPPTASITTSTDTPTTGEAVTFTAHAGDPDGTIASYRWDFGDGARANGMTATHVYVAGGTTTVHLTVVDDDSVSTTVSLTFNVAPAPVTDPPVTDPPVTDPPVTPPSAAPPLTGQAGATAVAALVNPPGTGATTTATTTPATVATKPAPKRHVTEHCVATKHKHATKHTTKRHHPKRRAHSAKAKKVTCAPTHHKPKPKPKRRH